MSIAKAGRPVGKNRTTAKQKLIKAGIELLKKKKLNEISIRDIAFEAGVNSSMIYHYFKSQEGFFEAVIIEMYSPVLKALKEYQHKQMPADEEALFFHMRNITRLLMINPWLPKLVASGLIAPDSPFRKFFATKIAGPIKKEMAKIINIKKNDNTIRDDLDTTLLIISAISLTAMPHLCSDIIEIFNEKPIDDNFYVTLQNHNFQVLSKGIKNEK